MPNFLPFRSLSFPGLSMIRPLLLACFMLAFGAVASATTAIMPSDDQMIVASRAIIRGRVLSQQCGFDSRRDIVYTYVTLRVKEVLKGQITSRELVLKEPGGQVATLGTTVFGSPRFTSGEDVVLYLDTWPDGSLRVHEMFLGKFTVMQDQRTSQMVAIRDVPGPQVEIIPLSPPGANPASDQESTSRLELSAYLRLVRNKVAANAERSRQFEDRYYQGQGMLREPPDYQDLARTGSLMPQFHLFENARWFEPDTGQPVTYLIDPDGAPPGVVDDINAAMTAWSTAPGCSLRVVNGGTASACTSSGVAVASFNNCTGDFSPGASGTGALAIGFINWNPGSTKVVSGTVFSQMVNAYLAFNPFVGGYGDHCRVQQIATHEMGHTLGLAHSWDPSFASIEPTPTAVEADATMYYIEHLDGRCASIRTDDINGISFIYPGQGSTGLPPIVSTTTLPSSTVAVAYSTTLSATGGTAPYTWSLASGSNPVPAGLSLSAGGTISGTPTTSGNFGFTVVVTDSASKTAQRDLSILVAGAGGGGVGGFNAHFVSQSVPMAVQPGGQFQITIVWNNVGSASWTGGNVYLGSQDPPNNTTWGTARLQFAPSVTINPGIQAQMPFLITAPMTPGVYQFQWQLTQDGGVGFFGDQSPSVAITVGNPAAAPPEIDTVVTPAAQLGLPYNLALAAAGGAPPYQWSMSGGDLPTGLSLGLLSGTIAGTPTAPGNFDFTVKLTDSKLMTAQRSLVISVSAPPLSATAAPLPTAITGTPYSQPLSATGGLPPYAWSVTTGSMPDGLKLDTAAGTISGTPSAQGNFNFTITVSDSQSTKATLPLSLHILVVGPDAVPHIDAAKYKAGPQKLIVMGQNFDPASVAQIDGTTVSIKSKTPTQLIIKPVALASGNHTIMVVNPNGVPVATLVLTVN